MSTIHYLQTTLEVVIIAALIVGLLYEPIIAKWEEKQKEKVLKAFKERRKYRENNRNV